MKTARLRISIIMIIIGCIIGYVGQAQAVFLDFSSPENTVRSFMEAVLSMNIDVAEKCFSNEIEQITREFSINTMIGTIKKTREEVREVRTDMSDSDVTQLILEILGYEKEELSENTCYVWAVVGGDRYEEFKFTVKLENKEWKIIYPEILSKIFGGGGFTKGREVHLLEGDDWQYPVDSDSISKWNRIFGEVMAIGLTEKNYWLGDQMFLLSDEIHACGDGIVRLIIGRDGGPLVDSLMVIEHFLADGKKVCSVYGGLSDKGILVNESEIVKRGQKVARSPLFFFGIRYGPFPGKQTAKHSYYDPIVWKTAQQWYWAQQSKWNPKNIDNWWLDPGRFMVEQPKLIPLDPAKKLPFATIFVPDDYSTIQGAVEAASVSDTVIVRDGAYAESITVDKEGLTVISENGPERTSVRAFKIEADYVRIDGFTVMGTNENKYGEDGIVLKHSNYTTIANNVVSNFVRNVSCGISIYESTANILMNNAVSHNGRGIEIGNSSDNTLIGNNMIDNEFGNFSLFGDSEIHFENNIDKSNLINGKPIYYIRNVSNAVYSNDKIGTLYLINCDNITVKDLNGIEQILLYRTNNSTIKNVNTSAGYYGGIFLESCHNNTLVNNTFPGIQLIYRGDDQGPFLFNNLIYLNNFIGYGGYGSSTVGGGNIWNSPKKMTYTYNGNTYTDYLGNYWAEHTKIDEDNNGISDTPYVRDNYPLMKLSKTYLTIEEVPKETSFPQSFITKDGGWNITVESCQFLMERDLQFTFSIENLQEQISRYKIDGRLIDNLGNELYQIYITKKDYKELAPHKTEKTQMIFPWLDEKAETVFLDLNFEAQEDYREERAIGPINLQIVPLVEKASTNIISIKDTRLRNIRCMKIYGMEEVPMKEDRIFLDCGREAVRLTGPQIPLKSQVKAESIFYATNSRFTRRRRNESEPDEYYTGIYDYVIRVNPHLSYYIAIMGGAYVLEWAQLELTKEAGMIKSSFLFDSSDGTARVKIFAIVNGKCVAGSDIYGIEARWHYRESDVRLQQLKPVTWTLSMGLPSQVAVDFLNLSFLKKEYHKAEKLLTPEALKEVNTEGGLKQYIQYLIEEYCHQLQQIETVVALKEKIEDDRSIVATIQCFDGLILRINVFLRKLNNVWKIISFYPDSSTWSSLIFPD